MTRDRVAKWGVANEVHKEGTISIKLVVSFRIDIEFLWHSKHNKHKYRNGIALRRHQNDSKRHDNTHLQTHAHSHTHDLNDNDGYLISHFVDVALINGVSLSLSDWKFMFLLLVWLLYYTMPTDVRMSHSSKSFDSYRKAMMIIGCFYTIKTKGIYG